MLVGYVEKPDMEPDKLQSKTRQISSFWLPATQNPHNTQNSVNELFCGRLLTTEIRNCYLEGSMIAPPQSLTIQTWHIDRLVFYARNPRKNDAAVDRMCSSIREFGFKCPVLARSDGEVVDGHLRLKAARKLGSWPGGDTTGIPVVLCDEWTPAQVKAFRLMVNRSVAWADWDEELLALELQELNEEDFDLSARIAVL